MEVRLNVFLIKGKRMIISGAEFGHFACLGCLRMFSYDRFKFLTIASIEVQYGTSKLLRSLQPSRVFFDCLGVFI